MRIKVSVQYQALAVFALTVCAGYLLSLYSWNGENYVHIKNLSSTSERDPAAIDKTYDFSKHSALALGSINKDRLILGAEVLADNNNLGLSLGHYIVKNKKSRLLACQVYDRVVATFAAEGIAISGDVPQFELEGACQVSRDLRHMDPLWIPVAKILGEVPADGELSYSELGSTVFRFINIPDQWPHRWALVSVRLVDTSRRSPDEFVKFQEIDHAQSRKIEMQWSK